MVHYHIVYPDGVEVSGFNRSSIMTDEENLVRNLIEQSPAVLHFFYNRNIGG
jgi:hypothetical protein